MDVLKRSDLQQLAQVNGNWHVSIYIPMHRAGNVYTLPREQFPNHGDVAAILRYVI